MRHSLEHSCCGAALLGAALCIPWSVLSEHAESLDRADPWSGHADGTSQTDPSSGPSEGLHRTDPPLGHTGGWGQPTCRACHDDSELNSPEVRLEVLGFPERYTPRATYRISISVAGEGQVAAGFQASTRFASGPSLGRQAGALERLNERVRVRTDSVALVQYAYHTEGGAELTSQELGAWTILWTAPESVGDVLLNVAANSANGDDSPIGDLIRTLERRSTAPPL